MMSKLAVLISGALFGFGLALSQMVDRQRVIGFLDVTGDWDPTLIVVLGGAVGVTLVTFRFVLRRACPACEEVFHLPSKTKIDGPLVLGAVLFGVGWGVSGYCPGPGLASIGTASINVAMYVGALCAGSIVCRMVLRK